MSGGFLRLLSGKRKGPKPTILLYHRIAEDPFDPWSMCVSPHNFAEQMQWLAANRTVLRLTDFADAHKAKRLAADALAITFDDGYACNALTAAPILDRLGLPATVFACAQPLERSRDFWWDELERIVLHACPDRLHFDGETVDLGPKHVTDSLWPPASGARTNRQRTFLAIWNRLQRISPERRDELMDELREQAAPSGASDPLKRPMTSSEARAAAPVFDFGSHSLTHTSLLALPRPDRAREISESRESIEALIGVRPTAFAYPFGDADEDCEEMVREAGYACACITAERAVTSATRIHALPRRGVRNVGADGLAVMLERP